VEKDTLRIIVAVGTSSPHKLNAVGLALFSLGVQHSILGLKEGKKIDLEYFPEQPCSAAQSFEGALRRSIGVMRMFPDASFGLGIENGIVNHGDYGTIDTAYFALVNKDGREWYGTSAGICMPKECVEEARGRGFVRTTVGQVVSEHFGGEATDPHKTLTGGHITRERILEDGLRVLFARYFAEMSLPRK
jgi:non-canonical (house-cleaning) NTP pyrophosphatase